MSGPAPPSERLDTEGAQNVLDVIDAAIDEHQVWLQAWHRSVTCNLPPSRDVSSANSHLMSRFGSWFDLNKDRALVKQSVFRELARAQEDCYAFGRYLAGVARKGKPVPVEEYDALIEKSQRFVTQARRIRDAFRKAISELDPLTGLHNRQVMIPELERERQRALRTKSPCTLAIADIDFFKKVNDTYGHAAGDEVLATAAGRFVSALRPYDSIFRYGGEEFLLCLPNTDSRTADAVLERLRQAIAGEPFCLTNGLELVISSSFGYAEIVDEIEVNEAMNRADKALYAAKHGGRNQVRSWTADMTELVTEPDA